MAQHPHNTAPMPEACNPTPSVEEPVMAYAPARKESAVARDMSVEELYRAIERDIKAIYAE